MNILRIDVIGYLRETMEGNWVKCLLLSTILNAALFVIGLDTVPKSIGNVTGISISQTHSALINLGFVIPRQWGFLIYTFIVCVFVSARYKKEIRELKKQNEELVLKTAETGGNHG